MNSTQPIISFIIPTLNEEQRIEASIASIRRLTAVPYEIVVADGRSTDQTVERARRLAARIVVSEKFVPGSATEKNNGGKAAIGKYLVFIDADAEIPEINGFFTCALGHFAAKPRLVALAVKKRALPMEETVASRFFFGLLNTTYRVSNNLLGLGLASGNFQMIEASAFRQLGGYREDMVAGEDNDMYIRLSGIGRTYYDPSLYTVESTRRARDLGWLRLYYRQTRNGIWVYLFNRSAYDEWRPVR